MKRRTFIKSLAIFTGLFTLGAKFEITSTFPFVRRKPTVPQMVSMTAARGTRTIRLPVPYAQKDDVLIAIVVAYTPNGAFVEIESQGSWAMLSRQETNRCVQESWYMKAGRDLEDVEFSFRVNGADRSAGSLSVIQGAEIST